MRSNALTGTEIYLDEASVMATENAVMAAVTAEGKTSIYNAACEPHVQGLCHFLVMLGAEIEGIGSNLLIIEGVPKLAGGDYTIQPDHTEVGSFIGLAAVTGSELRIKNAGVEYLRMTRLMFEKLGVEIKVEGEDLLIPKKQKLTVQKDIPGGIPKIDDAPWPGFPADLTSIMTVVATQCTGAVLIFEKMFESRLFWVDKLIEMGAQIILCDPHRAVVSGPTPLKGARVSSPDIRAGMALLIAALGAKGTTEIHNIDQIDRGYEKIDQRLNALGAKIQRVNE
jgi:UDP-N-acetylglucosamine 1-carboxyvinyltransferase